jgi:hypothetical protein
MMRLATWSNLFSLLAAAGGAPLLLWLGVSVLTSSVAVGTAIAAIQVIAHLIGTYRVGHAI